MTDEALDKIVREVLAAIQSRGLGATQAGPQAKGAAQTAPATRARPGAAAAPSQPKARRADAPRKIFLTAEMLLQRLAREDGQGRMIDLAHNEFLTPAATDLADERHLAVRKLPPPLASPDGAGEAQACGCPAPAGDVPAPAPGRDAATATIGLVMHKPNELVRRVLDSLARERITVFDYNRTGCWIVNARALCEAVASGGLCGGVVMVPLASDAVVLANKVRGVRAVAGSSPAGLAAAMDRLAPNVLVLEHSSATFHEVRTMLRMFAGPRPAAGSAETLLGEIEKLERA